MSLDPSKLDRLARMALSDPVAARELLERRAAERSLLGFVNLTWPILEPGRKFVTGWPVEAIAEHLEAVERKEIRRLLVNVPPGCTKPVWEEESVLTARGRVPLKDIRVGDLVLTHRGRFRAVAAVHEQGELPLVCVETELGRAVKSAPDHPFLTPGGWREARHLRPGEAVAVTPVLEESDSEYLDPREARFLGYLVGDGGVSHGAKTFTNEDPEILDDFECCAHFLGFGTRRRNVRRDTWTISLNAGHTSRLREYLEQTGLNGKNSYTKRVPPRVDQGGLVAVAHFLGAYWSCDGYTGVRHQNGTKTSYLSKATTVSLGLAYDLQHLLARIGIPARVRTKIAKLKTKRQGDMYTSYEVAATDQHTVSKFVSLPGLCSRKRERIKAALPRQFDGALMADRVLSVTPCGVGRCRCLTVEEDHSFTAGDLVVSNSMLCNVFFPSWCWGPRGHSSWRFLSWSYSERLTFRDSQKCLNLIGDPLYQKHWGERVQLDPAEQSKAKFALKGTGWKLASSVGGAATGERGDVLVIDDPLNATEIASEAALNEVLEWFTTVVNSRVNDHTSAIVVIMQRLHQLDVAGHILEHDLGYDRLIVPMEYEPDHPYQSRTTLGWEDPRTEPGELMWPERFPADYVAQEKATMASWGGDHAISAQYQQRPSPKGGGMFKRADIQIVMPHEVPPGDDVRGWDLAGTKDRRAPYTVGLKLRRAMIDGRPHYYITDVRRGKLKPGEVRSLILKTAEEDTTAVYQSIPQDPGQAGKAQRSDLAALLEGYAFGFSPETGSKEDRARLIAAQAEVGNLSIVRAPWTEALLQEMESFPAGAYKDQVDALSRAFSVHVRRRTTSPGVGATLVEMTSPEID